MKIKNLESGGIIANYRCAAACGHCLYGCSPTADDGYITEQKAEKVCKKLYTLGCRSVHIGGGEPFLNVDGLAELVKVVLKSGLELEYIETNAAWITEDTQRNQKILTQIAQAGGNYIMVSTDPFHIEFIPLWKPIELIRLLESANISYFVWQRQYLPILAQLDIYKKYSQEELQQELGYDIIIKCAREYGMRFNGRALNLYKQMADKKPAESFFQKGGCNELASTNHYHVDLYGYYVPPGCTGIGIKIDDIGKDIDLSQYTILSLLCGGGISSLWEYALSHGYKPNLDGYVSKCDICFDIRKYLINSNAQLYPELSPKSFYRQNY